jgi:hypothetical protein
MKPRFSILAICVLSAGCTFWRSVPNDPESQAYIDWIASNELTSWDASFYKQQAAPELLDQFSTHQFERLGSSIRNIFGKMVEYHNATGMTRILLTPDNKGTTEVAEFQARVDSREERPQ